MSANVLALSQENRRFLSCHGQISCKSLPPSKPLLLGRTAELIAKRRRDPDAPPRTEMIDVEASGAALADGHGKAINSLGRLPPALGIEIGKAAAAWRAAPSSGLDKINDRGSIPLPSM